MAQSVTQQPIPLKHRIKPLITMRRSPDVFNYCNIYSLRLIEINLIANSLKLPSKSVKRAQVEQQDSQPSFRS